ASRRERRSEAPDERDRAGDRRQDAAHARSRRPGEDRRCDQGGVRRLGRRQSEILTTQSKKIPGRTTMRRHLGQLSLAILIAAGASQASAQSFPARPITLLVPAAAGGPTDAVS